MNWRAPSEIDPSRGPQSKPLEDPKQRLHQRAIEMLRAQHYSPRTVKSYAYWILRYLEFHADTHPKFLREAAVNAFLSHLAVEKDVAAPTQNQALSAVIYLYAKVLKEPLDQMEGIIRARKPKRTPLVLTPSEVQAVLSCMSGTPKLVAMLLYGTGMRLSEGLSIRVKDLDFARREVVVRGGKGAKDRVTMLPDSLQELLKEHLLNVREQHRADQKQGLERVPLPHALARKYPTPTGNGPGSGYSPQPLTTWLRNRGSGTAITFIKPSSRRRSERS